MTGREEFSARIARVRSAMAERGLKSLIVYYSGQHALARMDQIFFLTDFRCIGPSVLLLTDNRPSTLVVTPVWERARACEMAAADHVIAVDKAALAQAVDEAASQMPAPCGLAGRGMMPTAFGNELLSGLPELADAEGLVDATAATRTPVELARLERAAQIADIGFATLRNAVRVGMRECELAAEVDAAMLAAGADDNFNLIGAGAHNVAIRSPSMRRLEEGDVVVGEITPCYRGYFAQLCRTIVLGTPTAAQKTNFNTLVRAQHSAFMAARPGAPGGAIAKAANSVIGEAGFAQYCGPPYMRTRGHGLGFGGVVPRELTDDNAGPLRSGMTMVVHPNQYFPDTGYLMLGDTIVIEATGPRKLTATPAELFSRGAAPC